MNATNLAQIRIFQHLHFLRRIEERALPVSDARIGELEAFLKRARPAFEAPPRNRYAVRVRTSQGRLRVIFDTQTETIVTAWRIDVSGRGIDV